MAPPWPEIFRQDRERKQDFDQAVRTYDALVATYTAVGYDLVVIPWLPSTNGCDFSWQTSIPPPRPE